VGDHFYHVSIGCENNTNNLIPTVEFPIRDFIFNGILQELSINFETVTLNGTEVEIAQIAKSLAITLITKVSETDEYNGHDKTFNEHKMKLYDLNENEENILVFKYFWFPS